MSRYISSLPVLSSPCAILNLLVLPLQEGHFLSEVPEGLHLGSAARSMQVRWSAIRCSVKVHIHLSTNANEARDEAQQMLVIG